MSQNFVFLPKRLLLSKDRLNILLQQQQMIKCFFLIIHNNVFIPFLLPMLTNHGLNSGRKLNLKLKHGRIWRLLRGLKNAQMSPPSKKVFWLNFHFVHCLTLIFHVVNRRSYDQTPLMHSMVWLRQEDQFCYVSALLYFLCF